MFVGHAALHAATIRNSARSGVSRSTRRVRPARLRPARTPAATRPPSAAAEPSYKPPSTSRGRPIAARTKGRPQIGHVTASSPRALREPRVPRMARSLLMDLLKDRFAVPADRVVDLVRRRRRIVAEEPPQPSRTSSPSTKLQLHRPRQVIPVDPVAEWLPCLRLAVSALDRLPPDSCPSRVQSSLVSHTVSRSPRPSYVLALMAGVKPRSRHRRARPHRAATARTRSPRPSRPSASFRPGAFIRASGSNTKQRRPELAAEVEQLVLPVRRHRASPERSPRRRGAAEAPLGFIRAAPAERIEAPPERRSPRLLARRRRPRPA